MAAKLKVLCFHPALAPYRVDFFNALAKRFKLHLVLLSKNLLNQKFDQQSLVAKMTCRISYLLSGVVVGGRHFKFGFGRYIKADHPDVVIGFEFGWTIVAVYLNRLILRGKYQIYTTTDDNEEQFALCRGIRRFLRNWLLRRIEGVIVTNEASAACIHRITNKCKAMVVPIIYDNEIIRRDEVSVFGAAKKWREENLRSGEFAAFFVGRLAEVKNLEWLIARVLDVRWPRNVRLFLVGDGPIKERLEWMASKDVLLSSRIQFLGRKEGDELQKYFAAEDVFILPSQSETFGAVVSESLHWGARCLVSRHVGAKDLVRETNGGYVFDDEDELYEKLDRLIAELDDWQPGRPSLIKKSVSEYIVEF